MMLLSWLSIIALVYIGALIRDRWFYEPMSDEELIERYVYLETLRSKVARRLKERSLS